MKKKLLFLLLSLNFSLIFCQNWFLLKSNNDHKYYVKDFLSSSDDDKIWVKQVSNKVEYFPNEKVKKAIIERELVTWKINCSAKKLGLERVITYDKKGNVLSDLKEDFVILEDVIPDSVGESLLNNLCQWTKNNSFRSKFIIYSNKGGVASFEEFNIVASTVSSDDLDELINSTQP
ncbi:hypothetical protein [Epilithonimonas sp.]|uniref:hypothetical protein n=1 Tax=Epilithonimonas sp. TaxID=2894511 RepID=UPI0028A60C14|nr:hypothetical protein [Epilithonimonas sp.]